VNAKVRLFSLFLVVAPMSWSADAQLTLPPPQVITIPNPHILSGGPADRFGTSTLVVDLNLDGVAEIVAGASDERPDVNTPADRAGYVFILKKTGPTAYESFEIVAPSPDHVEDNLFGYSLAAGDFDHDGDIDLAIGAPGLDVLGKESSGKVFVFGGPWPLTDQNHIYSGEVVAVTFHQPGFGALDGALFGYRVAGADVDSDLGYPPSDVTEELIATAPFYHETPASMVEEGAAFVFGFGIKSITDAPESPLLPPSESTNQLGRAIGTGHVTRDQSMPISWVRDIVLGARGWTVPGLNDAGRYEVFRDHNFLRDSARLVEQPGGSVKLQKFGDDIAIANFDAIDGDPWDDVAVGASGYENLGIEPEIPNSVVVVMRGGDPFQPEQPLNFWKIVFNASGTLDVFNLFGRALVWGHFNADPYMDVAVGDAARGEPPMMLKDQGVLEIYWGKSPLGTPPPFSMKTVFQDPNPEFNGNFAWDLASGQLGNPVSRADLVVGAPGSQTNRGKLVLYLFE